MANEEFWLWVEREMESRGLSYYRIERQAGLSNAAISKHARAWAEPTLTVCKAIAQVFDILLTEVLRRAGHLSPAPSPERLREYNEMAEQLASLPDGPIRDEAMASIWAIAESARRRSRGAQQPEEE